jgi:hypothetical protein
MIATRSITAGELILTEPLLFSVKLRDGDWNPMEISKSVFQLSPPDLVCFLSLHNAQEGKMPFGADRFQSNCTLLCDDSYGIFPTFSRINHHCSPNAIPKWHEDKQVLTVYAFKDVKQGEEFTVCYPPPFLTRDERRGELEKWWGFLCRCDTCGASPAAVRESDARRQRIKRIVSVAQRGRYDKTVIGFLHLVSALLSSWCGTGSFADCTFLQAEEGYQLMVQEGLQHHLANYSEFVYGAAYRSLDEAKAKLWAARTYEWGAIVHGRDVPWKPYKGFMSKPGPAPRGHAH